MNKESANSTPKRTTIFRYNRTTNDLLTHSEIEHLNDSNGNGLKAVSSVTGAINSFFRLSSPPLSDEPKSRSFESLNTVGSEGHLLIHQHEEHILNKRSGNMHSQSKGDSEDLSKTSQSVSNDSPTICFTNHEHSPNVTFSVFGDDSSVTDSIASTSSGMQRGAVRRSTGSLDLGEKSFENSLNHILNKCSATSLEVVSDIKDEAKKAVHKKKNTPWYTQMLSPTYKTRSEDFKKQFKDIPSEERLIVDYSCALQKEILVHGRMFLTQNCICFYANIFRWETVVTIPLREVTAITKEKTARVIPNAVQVSTDRDRYFFTSFTARDKTFMMLFRMWQNVLLDQPLSPQELWHCVHSCYGDDLGLTSSDDDYVPPPSESKDSSASKHLNSGKGDSSELLVASDLQNGVDERDSTQADISLEDSGSIHVGVAEGDDADQTDFSDTTEDDVSEGEVVCSEHDHLVKLAHNEVYHLSVDKLFELLFTDCEFFRMFIQQRKYTDVTLSPWQDETGETISRVREVSYTIPLNAPFGPKTSHTIEKHTCFKQSQPGVQYVIDAECTPLGIPYADAFYVMNRYCLLRVSKEKSRLRVTSEVKYRKSVWGVVKNMIERNSMQGVMDYFQCLGVHLRKECENQQKVHSQPTIAKRKLRKRRSHGLRSTAVAEMSSASRQMSRSTSRQRSLVENVALPPTPVRNVATSQKEEKLLRMNTDTLIRVVCFILVLLVMFNALLFYKLWSLELVANVLYLPRSQQAFKDLEGNPPQSHADWMKLLQQQQRLHEAEMSKWQDLLGASIVMVDQMKTTLSNLQGHISSTGRMKTSEDNCETDGCTNKKDRGK
ncbi:protein Aster-B-like [Dreissena polymorpha]|uniref:protein Aster-B-like n=1 Tax=Dreissena polymorpha TaxID=45954 RepID=UPI002263F2C8|nr:protein Aster-B-like [Dreissena polymorpha]